jgi:DNA repair photolyase
MKIKEIVASSILVHSKLPDTDYVVNPYTGCEFGCLYCYASFMGRFVGEAFENWGRYVYVKTNAVELCAAELARWSDERRHSTLLLSSVTDPYQGLESKYKLTRGILEVFAIERYPGLVSMLTKSPMVLRDLDVLTQLPRVEVGMTITTTDDKVSRFLEVRAPLASRRLNTLRKLNEAGVPTYAFVGPLLPHFRYQPDLLDELFERIAATGVTSIYVEHMNLKAYIRSRLWQQLENEPQHIRDVYAEARTDEHRIVLDALVAELLEKHGLSLRLGEVLYHNRGREGDESAPSSIN